MAEDTFFDQFETVAPSAAKVPQEDVFFNQFETIVPRGGTPEEALSRYTENAQLTQLLGGEPINSEGKTYSQTQGIEDAKIIRRDLLNQQQTQAQKEAVKQAEIAQTGNLGSVLAGAETGVLAPLSLGMSGLQAASKRLGGLPENALDTAIQQNIAEIQAKAAQNPLSGTVGTIVPNLFTGGVGGVAENVAGALTAGSLKAAAPLIGKAAAQTAQSGALNTLVNTGIRKIAGVPTTGEDIVGDVAFGLLGGRKPELDEVIKAGGRKIFPILNDKQTLASIRLNKNKEEVTNILANVGKFTEEKLPQKERLNSGEFTDAVADIAPFFQDGKGVDGFLDAANKSLKERALIFQPIVKEANPFLFRRESLLPQIEAKLAKNIPEPATREAALGKVQSFIENVTPDNVLPLSGQLNDDLGRFYRSATPQESADLIFAKKAVRDTFSEIVKNTLSEAGVDPNIYSKYGLVAELQDIIGDLYQNSKTARSFIKGRETREKVGSAISTLVTVGMRRGVPIKQGAELVSYTGGEVAKMDRQINKIFDKITPAERMSTSDFNEIYDAARQKRAELDKIGEFETSLLAAQKEKLAADAALNATPQELQGELSKLMNESVTIEEAGRVGRALDETLPEGLKKSYKALRRLPTDGPQGLLSNYQHALNTSGDSINIARLETELVRRLDLKKDAKHWPVIRDLLGIPEPAKTLNVLPSKRELNLSEAIKSSVAP